jgi:hypothetical protein
MKKGFTFKNKMDNKETSTTGLAPQKADSASREKTMTAIVGIPRHSMAVPCRYTDIELRRRRSSKTFCLT